MRDSLGSFGNAAPRLARNPLGIIALFIVLVYGFAALVVGPFGGNLGQGQSWIMVIFLVLFPFIVLGLFAHLVIHHHLKLYAPRDYRTDEAFQGVAKPEEQKQRIQEEISDSLEIQSIAHTSSQNYQAMAQQYILAEELALRQIQSEIGIQIIRQASFRTPNGRGIFDGAIVTDKEVTLIEVKYVTHSQSIHRRIRELRGKAEDVAKYLYADGYTSIKLLIFFVAESQIEDLQRMLENQSSRTSTSKVAIQYKFSTLDGLEGEFGIRDTN